MIHKRLWVNIDFDPECGCYEHVEGQPTVGDVMMVHQCVYQALRLAWEIWAKPWQQHAKDDPFDNIDLATAVKVGWIVWKPSKKRGPA